MLKKFHFYRFEFKYIVPEKYKPFIRNDLRPFMCWDNYARQRKQKRYLVNSLYFDSYNFQCFREKVQGIKKRFKLRLRVYNSKDYAENKEVFFEIKKKNDAVVIKDRGMFARFNYKDFISTKNFKAILRDKNIKKRNILEKFLFLRGKFRMLPKVKVIYEREPFEGIHYQNLRITFDSNIKAVKIGSSFSNGFYTRELLKNNFILEVKFRGLLPYWLHRIIQKYQLERVSFSKYCRAVSLCYN